LKPKKKIYNHIFDNKDGHDYYGHSIELKKCKSNPFYFYENYWLPYSQEETNTEIEFLEKILESYWND